MDLELSSMKDLLAKSFIRITEKLEASLFNGLADYFNKTEIRACFKELEISEKLAIQDELIRMDKIVKVRTIEI